MIRTDLRGSSAPARIDADSSLCGLGRVCQARSWSEMRGFFWYFPAWTENAVKLNHPTVAALSAKSDKVSDCPSLLKASEISRQNSPILLPARRGAADTSLFCFWIEFLSFGQAGRILALFTGVRPLGPDNLFSYSHLPRWHLLNWLHQQRQNIRKFGLTFICWDSKTHNTANKSRRK